MALPPLSYRPTLTENVLYEAPHIYLYETPPYLGLEKADILHIWSLVSGHTCGAVLYSSIKLYV